MGAPLGLLVLGGILTLWIVAFMRMHKFGGSKGVRQFLLYLGLVVIIGGILFLIIVVPVIDCSGFLCGIEEFLIFLLGCIIILIVMPILMMTVAVNKLKMNHNNQTKPINQEIIDEI